MVIEKIDGNELYIINEINAPNARSEYIRIIYLCHKIYSKTIYSDVISINIKN